MDHCLTSISELREQFSTLRADAENLRADSTAMVESLWEVFCQVNRSAETQVEVKYRTFIRTQASDHDRAVRTLNAEHSKSLQAVKRRAVGLKSSASSTRALAASLLQGYQADFTAASDAIVHAVQQSVSQAKGVEAGRNAATAELLTLRAQLASHVASSSAQIAQLQKEGEQAAGERDAALAVQQSLQHQLADAHHELSTAQAHAAQAKEQHSLTLARLEQEEGRRQEIEGRLGQAEEGAQGLEGKMKAMQEELVCMTTSCSSLQAELTSLMDSHASALAQCAAQVAMHQAEVQAAQAEAQGWRAQARAAEDLLVALDIPAPSHAGVKRKRLACDVFRGQLSPDTDTHASLATDPLGVVARGRGRDREDKQDRQQGEDGVQAMLAASAAALQARVPNMSTVLRSPPPSRGKGGSLAPRRPRPSVRGSSSGKVVGSAGAVRAMQAADKLQDAEIAYAAALQAFLGSH